MEIRELNGEMEYTVEERDTLAGHGIAIDTLRDFLRANGPMNLDVAIGGILGAQTIVAEGGVVAGSPEAEAVLTEQAADGIGQESPVSEATAE